MKNELFHMDIETAGQYKDYDTFLDNDERGAKLFLNKYEKMNWSEKYDDINAAYLDNAGIISTYGRIVCISFGYESNGEKHIRSFYGDDERDIVESFNNLLKKIETKSYNLCGGEKNIKFLIEQSKGEYIAYLDGDDYWTDVNKLQKQIDFLDSKPDYVMTFTGHWIKYKEGGYAPSLPYQWLCASRQSEDITTETLLNGNWISYGRVWRNIDIVKDWMMDLPYMDWPMNYELSKYGKIQYLDFPSGVYRQHSGGVYSELTKEQELERTNRVINKLLIDYDNYKNNI